LHRWHSESGSLRNFPLLTLPEKPPRDLFPDEYNTTDAARKVLCGVTQTETLGFRA